MPSHKSTPVSAARIADTVSDVDQGIVSDEPGSQGGVTHR
jgi:hypothetical protein